MAATASATARRSVSDGWRRLGRFSLVGTGGSLLGLVGPNLPEPPSKNGGEHSSRPKRVANCSSQIHGCLQRSSYSRHQPTRNDSTRTIPYVSHFRAQGGSPGSFSHLNPDAIHVSNTLPAIDSRGFSAPGRRRSAPPLAPLDI